MVHEILAHRVMPPRREGDLQFGSDTVDGTYQYRLAHFRKGKTPAERSDAGKNTFGVRCARHSANGGNGAIGLVNVDARVAIGNRCYHLGKKRTSITRDIHENE